MSPFNGDMAEVFANVYHVSHNAWLCSANVLLMSAPVFRSMVAHISIEVHGIEWQWGMQLCDLLAVSCDVLKDPFQLLQIIAVVCSRHSPSVCTGARCPSLFKYFCPPQNLSHD